MRTNVRLFLMQIAPIFVASIPLKFSEMHEIGGHPKQSPHVLSYLPLERSSYLPLMMMMMVSFYAIHDSRRYTIPRIADPLCLLMSVQVVDSKCCTCRYPPPS
jgi:hypothetical protein